MTSPLPMSMPPAAQQHRPPSHTAARVQPKRSSQARPLLTNSEHNQLPSFPSSQPHQTVHQQNEHRSYGAQQMPLTLDIGSEDDMVETIDTDLFRAGGQTGQSSLSQSQAAIAFGGSFPPSPTASFGTSSSPITPFLSSPHGFPTTFGAPFGSEVDFSEIPALTPLSPRIIPGSWPADN